MPARPRPAALEAEGATESRTARLSRHALNTRRTEIRTVAHWRLESRRAERSERQRNRTASGGAIPTPRNASWNFFRHGVRRGQLFIRVLVLAPFARAMQEPRGTSPEYDGAVHAPEYVAIENAIRPLQPSKTAATPRARI